MSVGAVVVEFLPTACSVKVVVGVLVLWMHRGLALGPGI